MFWLVKSTSAELIGATDQVMPLTVIARPLGAPHAHDGSNHRILFTGGRLVSRSMGWVTYGPARDGHAQQHR